MSRGAGSRVLALVAVILAMAASASESAEGEIRKAIRDADAASTLEDLATVVRNASACCRGSRLVSQELMPWLRESHPIYSGRLPTEANQFRGFLLAALGEFAPSDELFGYVKAGFQFGDHAFDIAAAAVAARNFPGRAGELLPLMERYLGANYQDAWVDVTTPELRYPRANPTRARDEILKTMAAFGRPPVVGNDAAPEAFPLRIIARNERKPSVIKSLDLIDQEGHSVEFADLQGRPFALTFLYSQCANPQKCVLTVKRLGELAGECAATGLAAKVGIYGMTYDPQFDSPSILKRYGSMYGMKFDRHVRLFKTTGNISEEFRRELALRVNYGAGSVNQHGIQLFVFDKRGRLAAMQDNEAWSPVDVRNVLAQLEAE